MKRCSKGSPPSSSCRSRRGAARCAGRLGLAIVPVDWEAPELVEAAHWHPTRTGDPTLRWLRGILRELSSAPEFMSGVPVAYGQQSA